MVHTGGYEVIQVTHRRDINLKLKLSCLLLCMAIFGIHVSLEALIRLHDIDTWRTYD